MEIIQEIGSYAGFAAVVGLAVLAALYFSQARDVRRLREWAGRAPEWRAGGPPVTGQRVVARPVPRPPGQQTTSGRPVPGELPGREPPPVPRPAGGAATAATGAGTAVAAGPGAATPAAARAAGAQGPDPAQRDPAAVSQDTMAHPPPVAPERDGEQFEQDRDAPEPPTGVPAVARPSAGSGAARVDAGGRRASGEEVEHEPPAGAEVEHEAPAGAEVEHEPPADDQYESEDESRLADERQDDDSYYDEDEGYDDDDYDEYAPETGERPVPMLPPLTPRAPVAPLRPGAPAGGSSILPPYEQSRPGGPPPGGRFSGRRRTIALVVGGVLALALVAFGVTQLLPGSEDPGAEQQAGSAGDSASSGADGASDTGASSSDPSSDPSQVTVAVLNGTTMSGLAAEIGKTVEAEGYRLGTVTNGADQARAESVVLFAPGARREAQAVARRLGIGQREPIDAASQQLAGDASVVVVAGADRIK